MSIFSAAHARQVSEVNKDYEKDVVRKQVLDLIDRQMVEGKFQALVDERDAKLLEYELLEAGYVINPCLTHDYLRIIYWGN